MKQFKEPKKREPVDSFNNLWCPLCDWHVTDSMASRRRLGVHLGNYHYPEVAFPQGTEPDFGEHA